ncbi:Type II traffic warden ATPase [Limihaloglobus sulfuriphilus]|uniref:Type II traffic warden ATPase n=1 Tax=Limihaloglobus sulfuriphilus TaxID=1851148 RepID=A0A1Q2MBR6_9BACT|nr:ATPase, T2SS/T4P/T4SS family [Limihaloglobus sulfuriphilus]AQQ70114.1 Type II traffic warden ATPase [Limihaloglobus sulfuriphilus]
MSKMPSLSQLRGRQVGRILIKMGLLTRQKVQHCLEVQQNQEGKRIGEIFLELGLISDADLRKALAAQRGMDFTDITGMDIPSDVISAIPSQMARTFRVVPIDYDPATQKITIAIDNPNNFQATDDLATLMDYNVTAIVTTTSALEQAFERYYSGNEDNINDIIGEASADSFLAGMEGRDQSIDLDEIRELAESNPVKKLLNLVLLQAIRDKAADIHFEPFEESYQLRYRIDGVLYNMVPPPKHIAVALSSRIKVMAELNIAERRLPQDGRIPLVVNGNQVDLRVSILPTMFGESVVLRILDRSQVDLNLDQLGLSSDNREHISQLIHRPNGIVLVTGPTGCGKTTTLYSALHELNTIDRKLITTEDPVEYDIQGVHQVQIRDDIGLSFAACLRSILRQDPDIILVGEIRDFQTAQISVEAALTGHLVLSTLHTNDAPSVIARLLDLGLEKFLVTATVEGVVAQRLVRKICSNCKREYEPDEKQLAELGLTPEDIQGKTFYYGKGCDMCNNTGYRGRVGIFEIMVLTDDMRELIMDDASTNVLRQEAKKNGMVQLRENGLDAIFNGITTIDEVLKETISEET